MTKPKTMATAASVERIKAVFIGSKRLMLKIKIYLIKKVWFVINYWKKQLIYLCNIKIKLSLPPGMVQWVLTIN